MKFLAVSMVMGPLMLIGALPAAGYSVAVLGSDAAIQLAAASDPAVERDSFKQQARDDMQEWQRKLHELADKAQTKGKAAGNAAGNDLNQAWTKAKIESDKLQTIGAEGWDSARASFERASNELAETWHKAHPDDK